ncbi:MAG: phospholipid scramblase 1 [Trizodia sp. TS-e1964]|nr:MAG: phospholipid scramblase 1 [Trizodia sp. TS-e1964]
MVDKLLLTYLLVDVLFLGSGALLAYVAISTQREINHGPTIDTVARDVLLDHAPLSATLANAVMIFLTFVISLPALAMPTNRAWLRLHGFLVVFSALFTLVIGLVVWHMTLQTRANLSVMWDAQPAQIQSFLQQKVRPPKRFPGIQRVLGLMLV